jgi:phosphoglycerate dehydrogenase-like enzyme
MLQRSGEPRLRVRPAVHAADLVAGGITYIPVATRRYMADQYRVGFIGLGVIGTGMASRVQDAVFT